MSTHKLEDFKVGMRVRVNSSYPAYEEVKDVIFTVERISSNIGYLIYVRDTTSKVLNVYIPSELEIIPE